MRQESGGVLIFSWGYVGEFGEKIKGSEGWTVKKLETGTYQITWGTPRPAFPFIVLEPINEFVSPPQHAAVHYSTEEYIIVEIKEYKSGEWKFCNSDFRFISLE